MRITFPDNNSSKKFTLKKFLLSLSLIFSFGFGIAFQSIFQVKQVNSNISAAKTKFQHLFGKNIIFLNTQREQQQLQKDNPNWNKVSIVKKLPNTLQVNIKKEKPFAQLKNKKLYLIVNKQGKILSVRPQPEQNLISISYFQTLRDYETKVNNTLSHKEIQYALKVLEISKNYLLNIEKIKINKPQRITLYLKKDLQAFLSLEKPIAKNLFILQNIIKSLEIKGIKAKIINLEFAKPTVIL